MLILFCNNLNVRNLRIIIWPSSTNQVSKKKSYSQLAVSIPVNLTWILMVSSSQNQCILTELIFLIFEIIIQLQHFSLAFSSSKPSHMPLPIPLHFCMCICTCISLYIPSSNLLSPSMDLHACFQGWPFVTGLVMGVLFLEEDHLCSSQLSSLIYCSLCRTEAPWDFSPPGWHDHWCRSTHFWQSCS